MLTNSKQYIKNTRNAYLCAQLTVSYLDYCYEI